MKNKNTLKKLFVRIKVAFEILFKPRAHWIFLTITNDEFIKTLKNEKAVVTYTYHCLQEYNMWYIMKKTAETKDDIDMILAKAEFEAKASEYIKNNT